MENTERKDASEIHSNVNYALLDREEPVNILAVEDDSVSMGFLEAQIKGLGHSIIMATDGQEALTSLDVHRRNIDVVLMDREMPIMDGLTAVKRMKASPQFRNIPVIMVTGADSVKEMQEGLDAGVFYYLTKPVEENMLRSVLAAAVREARQQRTLATELSKHRTSFNLIESCKFRFRTLADAESLAAFIANCFPEPERVLPGVAELLINAIEHGNLGLGYERKTTLIDSGTWRGEIERMQNLPQNEDKYAYATISHKDGGTYIVVEDQGAGFEWRDYLRIDPARAGDNHGRGIAQANTVSFDKLGYNEVGNRVIAFVGRDKDLDW